MQVYITLLAVYAHGMTASFRGVIAVRVDGCYAFPVSAGLARFDERFKQSIVEAQSQALFCFSKLTPQDEGVEELGYKWVFELDLGPVLDELERREKSSLSEVL